MTKPAVTTGDLHEFVMPNGRHKDEPITRIPVSYLRWMVNVGHTFDNYAEAELSRRGTVLPDFEVSGHAIDRASLICWPLYKADRREDEGLHAWLVRRGKLALESVEPRQDDPGRFDHEELSLRFDVSTKWPVLKTVVPSPQGKKLMKQWRHREPG